MVLQLVILPIKQMHLSNWKYNAANLYESIKYTRYQNIAVTTTESDEAEAGRLGF